MRLENYIDHTLLKPDATDSEIKELCLAAKQHRFYAVCVNGCHVPLAKRLLEDSNVKVAAVIGFPLGANSTPVKVFEASEYVRNGADEIDMVLNIGWLRARQVSTVQEEIAAIKKAIGQKILKVILETCSLTREEIKWACEAAIAAGADFVKTSTGFGTGGATLEDVAYMHEIVGNRIKKKASGGIKDAKTARKYIKMGVSRIGTSSGVAMVAP